MKFENLYQKYAYKLWKHLGKRLNGNIMQSIYPPVKAIEGQSAMIAKLAEIENILKLIKTRQSYYFQVLAYQDLAKTQNKKVFEKYRGVYKGRDAVLCASGPSFNYFDGKYLKNAVKLGVNNAVLNEKIKFDYSFVIDYNGIRNRINDHKNKTDVKKLFGIILPLDFTTYISCILPKHIIEENNAEYFYITNGSVWTADLTAVTLSDWASVVFPAMDFLFWTRPRRIFIVGADCGGKHYDGDYKIPDETTKMLLNRWKRIKFEAPYLYPDTEIISVNPVGLKGLFHDVYTESYLNDHPEIDRKTVEILNEED